MNLLDIINEQVDIEDKESWKIKNDAEADWWIELKQEELAQIKRLKMQIQAKLDFYKQKLESIEQKEQRIIESRDSKLREYFESLDKKHLKRTKTLLKYELPSGKLKLKFKSPEYKRDDKKLVEYLENRHPEFVKIKKSPDWSNFKKKIKIAEGKAINIDTGEIIDCIDIVEREPEFVVEV